MHIEFDDLYRLLKIQDLDSAQRRRFLWVFSIVLLSATAVLLFPPIGFFFFIVVFIIAFMAAWSVAGLMIFRSLFVVSAGLSLLLYLAELFCSTPHRTAIADEALKSLLLFGLLYITGLFFKGVFDELKKGLVLAKKMNNDKKPLLAVVIVGLFIGMYLIQLYQVLHPVVMNLCVYKT